MELRRTRREWCEDPEACSGLGVVRKVRKWGQGAGQLAFSLGSESPAALACSQHYPAECLGISSLCHEYQPYSCSSATSKPPVPWATAPLEKSPRDPFLPAGLQGLHCAAYMKHLGQVWLQEFEFDWKEEGWKEGRERREWGREKRKKHRS